MNDVTVRRSHFALMLIAIVVLLVLVIAQWLKPPTSLTGNFVDFANTLRADEGPFAVIIDPDARLKVFGTFKDSENSFKIELAKSCGSSAHTEIPADCLPKRGKHVRQNRVVIDVYESEGSSQPSFLLSTQGGNPTYYGHCPTRPYC